MKLTLRNQPNIKAEGAVGADGVQLSGDSASSSALTTGCRDVQSGERPKSRWGMGVTTAAALAVTLGVMAGTPQTAQAHDRWVESGRYEAVYDCQSYYPQCVQIGSRPIMVRVPDHTHHRHYDAYPPVYDHGHGHDRVIVIERERDHRSGAERLGEAIGGAILFCAITNACD